MIRPSIHATPAVGEREVVPSTTNGSIPAAIETGTDLAAFATQLGLSFWGHQVRDGDFIVVRREALEPQGAMQ